MRITASLFAIAACTCVANAQYVVITPDGKKVGTATYAITSTGGKITTRLVLNTVESEAKIRVDMYSVSTSAGDPVSYNIAVNATGPGSSTKSNYKFTYSGRKVTILTDSFGMRRTHTATSPGPVRDVTMVWLTGKVPAVGTKTTYYQPSQQTFVFYKHEATYHGLRDVKTASGRVVSAHVIGSTSEGGSQKIYFTSKGELIKLESGPVTVLRR